MCEICFWSFFAVIILGVFPDFAIISIYLHFRSNLLMNLKIFATIHSLMNYTHLIDSCQAHLPVQYPSNIELIFRSDWQGATPSRTCKTSLLFAPLAVSVQAGCSTFPFYTPTKPLIWLYFQYKTVLITKLKIFLIFFKIFIIKCKYKQ